jgi:hypothetical protein
MNPITAITVIISTNRGQAMTIVNLCDGELSVSGNVDTAVEAMRQLAQASGNAPKESEAGK